MKFLRLILGEAGESRIWLIFCSTVPGLAMGVMIAVVNIMASGTDGEGEEAQLLGAFVAACAISLYMMSYAFNATSGLTQAIVNRTRIRISSRIRDLDLAAFEQIGAARISIVLNRDLQTLSEAAPLVVSVMSSIIILIFAALYVAYLSYSAFAITIVVIAAAVYFYRRTQGASAFAWKKATSAEESFFRTLGHLLGGFKETKIDYAKGEDLLTKHILPTSAEAAGLKVEADRHFNAGGNRTNLFFYILIGLMVFALPHHFESASISTKVIMTIVFVGGAIEGIMKGLPMIAKADIAVESVARLEADLSAAATETEGQTVRTTRPAVLSSELRADAIAYSYVDADGGTSFTVGPCDLTIPARTITFIVGGNGSGKSTLIKLLTNLYKPTAGRLFWDGAIITPRNAIEYRNLFSIVFSDFYLFDRIYGMDEIDYGKVDALLNELELSEKVRLQAGAFSTVDLSTGQRKRLAMLVARLEDKPVYVFDEWAADQDPSFRRYYYEVLLPSLRDSGRTVIAITHDDRFFGIADRVVFMEEGRIARIVENA